MFALTMDFKASSQVLGITPKDMQELIIQEGLSGILKLKDGWRVSIFTLAQLLNSTPDVLLEFLEDYHFGHLIEEVEDDEFFEGETGRQVYERYLAEAQT